VCSDGSAKSKEHARVSKDEDGVGLCGVSRRTNLRLWETIAASVSIVSDCYLQWMAQLQRVAP
jgi:hypothetical protein